jgi:probable HAF family extracellular repeat protein
MPTSFRLMFPRVLSVLVMGLSIHEVSWCETLYRPAYIASTNDVFLDGMNDLGQLVGWYIAEPQRALLYSNGQFQDISSWLGGVHSNATGINDAGQIIGQTVFKIRPYVREPLALLYSNGTLTVVAPGDQSFAEAINQSGQVVGLYVDQSGHGMAFLYSNGTSKALGTLPGNTDSLAWGINDKGQIVGETYLTGSPEQLNQAFLYQNGQMTKLPAPEGTDNSEAMRINDKGQVLVNWTTATNQQRQYLYNAGTIEQLGTLGGENTWGGDLNDIGQVVGYSDTANGDQRAMLYQNGTIRDLNTLLLSGVGAPLTGASRINDRGQILAYSENEQFYLLNPVTVPEPQTWPIFLCLSMAAVCFRRFIRTP